MNADANDHKETDDDDAAAGDDDDDDKEEEKSITFTAKNIQNIESSLQGHPNKHHNHNHHHHHYNHHHHHHSLLHRLLPSWLTSWQSFNLAVERYFLKFSFVVFLWWKIMDVT